ncbi:MAG: hypothetical protein ABW217_21435 [Polyangiaceae bacterium]
MDRKGAIRRFGTRLKRGAIDPFVERSKEAIMDERRKDEARKPEQRHIVTERELLRVLDESLWQVERRRVNPSEQTDREAP